MIAIVADIHGNWPALQAVLKAIDALGCRRIVSLGDVTGYYAQPAECIDELVARQAIQLLGNHDQYLVQGTSCPRSRTVSELIRYQRNVVRQEQIALLAACPSIYMEDDLSMVHGGWFDYLDEYLYHLTPDKFPGKKKLYFSGHTHVQVLAQFGEKIYCNPGSVGQPRDGDYHAAFAIVDGFKITLQRVAYDVKQTIKAMKLAGFMEKRLWDNLFLGAQIGGRVDRVTF